MRKLRRSGWNSDVIWTCQLNGEPFLTERLESFLGDARLLGAQQEAFRSFF